MNVFDVIAILIFFSGVFIFINAFFLKLPSAVGLMVMALVLSLAVLMIGSLFPNLNLARYIRQFDYVEILDQFVLNVILFSRALNLNFQSLGKQKVPVLVLGFFGVVVSSLVIATSMWFVFQAMSLKVSYMVCLIFGTLISAMDPTAITSMIKRFDLSQKLENKVLGEAIVGSSLAVVLALIFVDIYTQRLQYDLTMDMALSVLARELIGGLILGAVFGWVGYKVLQFIDNEHVQIEVLITLALVMSSAWIADYIMVSSKMMAITTGLMIGNLGHHPDTEHAAGTYVFKFWKLMEDTLGAMLFVLIGFEMLVIPLRLDYFAAGFFAVNIVLFARWVSVFIPVRLMSFSHDFDNSTISVLSWGALRGGLPVAVSLSMHGFEGHELIVTMTYVVVVCSVLYQGLTLPMAMKNYRIKHTPEIHP
ncbi:sodium:proton antiporter [Marinoscillum sp. MHG1-6]|uniref:cation:proton antiporter n=1 Tax=Marinoscillum sp. MHG1-6 TaxID=2959627 RepID=UPI00215825DB|nr:cation:proton antiporter [Marinoscillum sp. MHG1-6]